MRYWLGLGGQFVKDQAVFVIAAGVAAASMLLVPPSREYISYIDVRVLCLLFCLMASVAGMQKTGVFIVLSHKLLERCGTMQSVSLALVLMSFFSSMLITNDVALITFVPFAIMIISLTEQFHYLIPVVVLQTVAANLGSMLTPVGNPQNLYLYLHYHIGVGEFFRTTAPVTVLALLLVAGASLLGIRDRKALKFSANAEGYDRKRLLVYGFLFLICIGAVCRLFHYGIALVIVLAVMLSIDRGVLKRVDYGLLATFVCFFIFAGNIGNTAFVQSFLAEAMEKQALLVSVLSSQVISNVPAAVLLSACTDNWRALLLGTDIGGLGTLIASLASLISFQFYVRLEGSRPWRYLLFFTAVNLTGLGILLGFQALVLGL